MEFACLAGTLGPQLRFGLVAGALESWVITQHNIFLGIPCGTLSADAASTGTDACHTFPAGGSIERQQLLRVMFDNSKYCFFFSVGSGAG